MQKRSSRWVRVPVLVLLAVLMLQGSAIAREDSESEPTESRSARVAAVGFDAVFLRPLAVVTLVVGAAMLPVAALLASPGGMEPIREATELFVTEPYEEAFKRPLGDF